MPQRTKMVLTNLQPDSLSGFIPAGLVPFDDGELRGSANAFDSNKIREGKAGGFLTQLRRASGTP